LSGIAIDRHVPLIETRSGGVFMNHTPEVSMNFTALLSQITGNTTIFALFGIGLFFALYLARRQVNRGMLSFGKIIHNAMRITAKSVMLAEKRLQARNREVLMAEGLENAERMVEREFDRITSSVQRDLKGYPKMQRKMSEVATRLEEDLAQSIDVPPSLPNWVNIIEAIANIKHTGDSLVSNMISDIKRTLEEQHKTTIESYRASTGKRHKILTNQMPQWRGVQKTLDEVGKAMANIQDRAKRIDRYMDDYEEIRKHSDKAARKLSSSSMTQFFISGLVLMIAIGGAVINFNLIALPMSEMVGGGSYIGPYKTSDVAGLVIILIELSMGIFLLESLRITRLFPVIGSMDDKMRIRMIWITLSLLTILAGVESALAFMRDRIAADMEALRQTLAGVEQTEQAINLIPTFGQMIMGFILPFALAFVAIPLENFISAARTVLGVLAAGFLRLLAFSLRLVGNVCYYVCILVISVYDIFVFPALWLEGIITSQPYKLKNTLGKVSKSPFKKKKRDKVLKTEDRTQVLESQG
jgi:hypothetical protein